MSYRGYSRGGGGYRGGNRGGGESSWRASNRGNFSGSRGRMYGTSPSNNYESRSRYFQGVNNDRYSSRGGRSDDGYRSYRSQESQDYSGGRDFGMRGSSPEPPRKRVRTDSYAGAPSRRSHERSFSSAGNEYSQNRNYYIGDKGGGGGYGGSDKGSYRDIRESRLNTEYSFRRPSIPSPRSPRGSYRGRSFSRGRGSGRGLTSSGGFLTRKRAIGESYAMRKRYIPTKSQDYLRRLKLYRLKRLFKDDELKDKKSDDDDDEEDDDDGDDAEEDKENDEEEEEGEETSSQDGNEVEEKEEGEVERENKDGEAGDEVEDKEKLPKKKEVKKPIKKVVKKTVAKKKTEAADKNSDGGKRESGAEETQTPMANYLGRPFIQLKCPQCYYTCVTFKEYGYHLGLKKHQIAMRSLSSRLRSNLARMRIEQRQKQRLLDEECKAQGKFYLRTFFCNICKLNYRTLKSQHQSTFAHKKMREFLLPFCKICKLAFKSPMLYEAHICDLIHIKRKAKLERLKTPFKRVVEDVDSGNELDPNNFMILDAVGSGDESEGEKSEGNEEVEGEKSEGEKRGKEEATQKKKKKKSEIKLGSEYCKLVEVYYCDLCKIYLPRLEDKKRIVTMHCRSRLHLQRWTRDIKIRRKAIQLHKERIKLEKKDEGNEEEPKKSKGEVQEDKEPAKHELVDVDNPHNKEGTENARKKFPSDETMDMVDKMWSVVDKDLTELLNEAEEATKSSDEDDDSRAEGGRYDRFKHSDKNIEKASEAQKDIKQDDEEEEESNREKRSNKSGQSNGSVSPAEKKKNDDTKMDK